MKSVVLGTRGSALALVQAEYIAKKIEALGATVTLKIIKTQGDLQPNLSVEKWEGKGFFTKEIEESLLKKEIDLAVHSHKDLPTDLTLGLSIVAITERERPEDVLLIRKNAVDLNEHYHLQKNVKIGTSSLRRSTQLQSIRPDLEIIALRGNVTTRIEKLRAGELDAIILAYSGLRRLNLDISEFELLILDVSDVVPAPAQGALALQIRTEDEALKNLLTPLHQESIATCIEVERTLLAHLEGGCSLPFGAYCYKEYQTYKLWISFLNKEKINFLKPSRFFLQDKDPKLLIQRALNLLKKDKIPFLPSVFISRNADELPLLRTYLDSFNIDLFCKKLIEIVPVPFSTVQPSDWIFFNSQAGVKCFFERKPELLPSIRWGVVGETTEKALQKFGFRADFVGQHADIKKVAKDFRALLETEKKMPIVLFPQSSISLRTVQEELSFAAKTIDLIVYRTKSLVYSEALPDADYFIFTSPSNVDSFFNQKENIDKKTQKMIALGKSTYEAIKDRGMLQVLLSEKNSEIGLLNVLLTDIYEDQNS